MVSHFPLCITIKTKTKQVLLVILIHKNSQSSFQNSSRLKTLDHIHCQLPGTSKLTLSAYENKDSLNEVSEQQSFLIRQQH